ncbi:MAG: hypothetical protein CO186_03340 [Zetaproteobacteria bacterium CG_4_9_14_3_um_filter_49_83]|nr:MAG: hypothetical protein AUJ56_00215 [Zetaproteobacteria bacterium CG1_02_49_23]PIQ32463.1 MAG: hypothetical protein COW62_07555 [Zetaproteobacteria bacterium CG17_big_fil_post_rev_8_21_14_2_50_50_13]PIV30629.1 MAG: hypothetical protein COS35_05705 [Zetaproteobacteria bacterium CG02_land_8_20_14_3_00_50_9]PIY55067.1 MAG: hypothetical protein COZ00_11490 [Zetaproteobacteria bacterium CG_4_10_14_0_8_um_filter_49_80]PJA35942.1 MAG: hypothetical protein CO186_03340 [Zetaproteobacteria bacterium
MHEDAIIELQSKWSHQEYLLQQLNEALISQQNQISKLSGKVRRLESMLNERENSNIARSDEESRPPHY